MILDQQTINKLAELKLNGMIQEYKRQLDTPDFLNMLFEERLGFLVDFEWTSRKNRLIKSLLSKAKLKDSTACLENIDYTTQRGIDRKVITRLSCPDWLLKHQNIIITGPTGSGKTFLGCAFGNMACRNGHSTRYYRVSMLLTELASSHGDGSYLSKLNALKKLELLILDDWGINEFTKKEAQELFEVIEDRNSSKSTIIIGQVPANDWHKLLPEPTIADAIIDRLIHSCHRLSLTGESMRKTQSKKQGITE
jgi:DNA replication protein DnaC